MGSTASDSRSSPEAFNERHSKEETQRLSEFVSGRPHRQNPCPVLILAPTCPSFPIDTSISLRENYI